MSHNRRPTTYVPDDVFARAPQATSSATRRCAVGSGSAARVASSVNVSRRCSSSNAPTSDSARLVTVAPAVETLPAIRSVFH